MVGKSAPTKTPDPTPAQAEANGLPENREQAQREKLDSLPSSEEVAARGNAKVPPVSHEEAWKIVQGIRDEVKHLGLMSGESLAQFIPRLHLAIPDHLKPPPQPPENTNPADAQAPRPQV